MTLNEYIKKLKLALNAHGEKLDPDNPNYLGTTAKVAAKYDFEILVKPKNADKFVLPQKPIDLPIGGTQAPWMAVIEADLGKKETDPKFQEKMNPFWKKIGLPSLKGLVGSPRAWCALIVFSTLLTAGLNADKLTAAAKSGDNYGQKIDFKKNGFPRGAIVRINHGSDCKSASGNHIGFSDGDCTAQDLTSGNFNMLGGNQGNMVKVSSFPVNDICSVSWPKEMPLPGKVLVSKGCKGENESGESTR